LFFKQYLQKCHDRLQAVGLEGDRLGWLRFFLEGVEETATRPLRQGALNATRPAQSVE
jgi:hypothetical protein